MEEPAASSEMPLFPGQLSIWQDVFVNPQGATAYNIGAYWEFIGPMDPSQFVEAIYQVVNATPALRLEVISHENGTPPRQRIRAPLPQQSAVSMDVSSELNPPGAARTWMLQDVRSAFDLTAFPLFRVAILKLAADWHYGYFVVHHLIVDGVGFSILLRDLADALGSIAAGVVAAPTSAAEEDLRTYVAAVNAYDQSDEHEAARRYWLNLHATPAPRVSLSMRDRQPVSAAEAIRVSFALPHVDTAALGAIARGLDISLTEILVAGVILFIHRMTGAEDIPIGLPVHGRPPALRNRLVWMCMNVLPLRFAVAPDLSLREFFHSVVAQFREALRFQSYRYEALRRDLGRLTGPGLFAISMNIIRGAGTVSRERRGSVHRNFYSLSTGPVEDLAILITDGVDSARDGGSSALLVELRANPATYARPEIESLADSFARLLNAVGSSGLGGAGEVPAEERQAS